MNLKTKKIFAREFLLLIVAAAIVLVSFSCTYLYNSYQRTKSQKIATEITTHEFIADSLSKPFDTKTKQHELLYQKFNDNKNVYPTDFISFEKHTWEPLNKLALQDSIKTKYDKWDILFKNILSDVGFNTSEELQEFITRNRITTGDSLNYQKAKDNRKEKILLESKKSDFDSNICSFKNQVDVGTWAFGLSLLILFACRYLYYAIKWSVNTLRQKTT